MAYEIPQGNTSECLPFLMVSSADHIAGVLGIVPTVTISKNGAAFAAPAGAVSEVGNGSYIVAPNPTDANTLGPLVLHATGPGCDPTDERFDVGVGVAIVAPAPGPASYSGNPSASDLAWVRFTIGDTGPSYGGDPWHFMDTEILGILALAADPLHAAVDLLFAWARQMGHNPNFNIGRFGENYDAAAKFLQEKAKELLASTAAGVGAYVGGVSVSDKAAKYGNTDRTRGSFSRGMLQNPDAGW